MGLPALKIGLLGELQLWRGEQAVELPASKKTRALLAYLVAAAQPQLRERLCDLLWEGPDDPRGALRWSLSKLRPLVNDKASSASVPAATGSRSSRTTPAWMLTGCVNYWGPSPRRLPTRR